MPPSDRYAFGEFTLDRAQERLIRVDGSPLNLTPQKQPISAISFHIPYTFLDKVNVDFDPYFTLIQTIADKVAAPAYDLQLDAYLTEPKFINEKPILIQSSIQLSKLNFENNVLTITL